MSHGRPTTLMCKPLCLAIIITAFALVSNSQNTVQRPPITGISHVAFFSSNLESAKAFYAGLLGLAVDQSQPNVYHVGVQSVEVEAFPPNHGHDLISHVAFATPDAEGIRRYLASHGVRVPGKVSRSEERRVGKECRSRWSP